MKRFIHFVYTVVALFAIIALIACGGSNIPEPPVPPEPPVVETTDFYKGADISWLTQMENDGVKFFYKNGTEGDCMSILKSLGMNMFRFRIWVNPVDAWSGTDDVITKARRATALGMDIMLDFHYSDSWADPSKQNVPARWSGLDLPELAQRVSEYTRTTLMRFKQEGIDVKLVQVGNETGNGMLWPYGKADTNPTGYVLFNNAGYNAVKDVYPEAKVIVHLQNGQDNNLYRWLFDILKKNGGKWDVIGMSLYPEPSNYRQYVSSCRANMVDVVSRYDKDVMLCEVGMGNSYVSECCDFLMLCMSIKQDATLKERFLGVLYWEPQVYNDWSGYRKGAFTSQGQPSGALDAYSLQ